MATKLDIKFGIDFELKRVQNTLAKMDWYNLQGYKPRLPSGINIKSSKKEIKNQIIKEFDEKKYKKVERQLTSDFSINNKQFFKKIKEIFKKDIQNTFLVYLTNYGVGGSYDFPNTIILNINMKKSFRTIVHEITHLFIEDLIQKYKISQFEKERTVDLILNSKKFGFLKYNYWQDGYNNAEKYIDDLFDDYFFKNPESFFSKIKNAR